MDKLSRKIHRVHMELGGKLPNSLRIKTQFLERLQSVSVVDGATHTQEDDVESNGCSLENVAEILCCSFVAFREHISHPGHLISLTQVASRGRVGIPSCCFKAEGVDTKSETSHTADDILRKLKKHVSRKPIRR
jgi:hypothetical protein